MSTKSNLNISPYYDDFDKDNQFYKVLFKPGFPVQARELSTLQSILQNQIESFGSHMFKDGSMVIPGNIAYDSNFYYITVEDDHLGIPVSLYIEQLVGLRLRGETSGCIISIDSYQYPEDNPDVTDLTVYIKYLESGDDNTDTGVFDEENIIVEETFVYGNTTVNAGDTVLTLKNVHSSGTGSAVAIESGVYFIRGNFIEVEADKIVLDPYDNVPSYRVGLNIDEQFITAKDDESLYDNARGFSNFAAPGADRLKIKTKLAKKALTDYDDTNFVELIRLRDGEIKVLNNQTNYNLIRDYIAKRTFEESGNYSLDTFDVDVLDSLNDGISGDGIFRSDELTDAGNIPDDDLMCVKVSSGTAYVRGYDISLNESNIVDVVKPRDKAILESALVPYQMGTVFKVNHASGVPAPNINDDSTLVELYNKRTTLDNDKDGAKIGEARAYSFALSDAAYSNDASQWDLHLFDVQIFTKIELNQVVSNTEVPLTSFVRGVSSGATGYVSIRSGGTAIIHLSEVTGKFIAGEQIIFNENTSFIRSVKSNKTFGIQDVKSVFQDTASVAGYGVSFTADMVLNRVIDPNFSNADTLTITGAGATTNGAFNFAGISTGTILRYTPDGETVERFNRIDTISPDGKSVTLSAVASIPEVCNGGLISTKFSTTFAFGVPNVDLENNQGLYAEISNKNVSDIDLSTANLIVGKNITGESTDGSGSLTFDLSASGISSAFYESFDEERYSVHYADKTIEPLDSSQFVLSSNGQSVTINGLEQSKNDIVISTTLKKQSLKSKQKNYLRSQKISVEQTAVGINTSLTGMNFSSDYGLRVEDKEISLNHPDAVKIIGVYESLNTLSPTLDKFTFPSGLSLDSASVLGEKIIGADTGAVAQIVNRNSSTEVEISLLSTVEFAIGEIVTFEESQISTTLQGIVAGNNYNITSAFELDKGQREQFYDYSRIVRKDKFSAPSRKLLIIFDRYNVPSNDNGDFYTVASYPKERFGKDVPHLKNKLRASDTLDFRPRVSPFTGSDTGSPFAFSNRKFGASGNVNPSIIVSPNESSIIGYNFYLPRIDKLFLDSQGELFVLQGESNIPPRVPDTTNNGMEIATIELPAYLYNPADAKIKMVDNVRFTMKDIGKLEDRIENLEITSSLSLLELNTKTFQVQDADGLSRFKTGFFVDDFKNTDLLDNQDLDCNVAVDVDKKELVAPVNFWSIKPVVALDPSINIERADYSADLKLLDPNVKKTGDLITLDYEEVAWLGNQLASRVVNVNPFNLTGFYGKVKLNPASDTWKRTVVTKTGKKTITGSKAKTYMETKVLSTEDDKHIRSRNVAFSATGLRPITRFYPFFDFKSSIRILPKLIQIQMKSGIFEVGETVEAYIAGKKYATFRIARPNHKTGNINDPKKIFNFNPFDTSTSLGKKYSASSDVLNVDINALEDEAEGKFSGFIPPGQVTTDGKGVVLLGKTSKAEARVTSIKLIADAYGDLYGSFFFEDPLTDPPPSIRFNIGTSTFTLSSDKNNTDPNVGSALISSGQAQYKTKGTVEKVKKIKVTVRVPAPVFYRSSSGGQKYKITNKFTVGGYQKMSVNQYRSKMRQRSKPGGIGAQANTGSGRNGKFGSGTNGKGRPSKSPLGTYPGRNIVGADPLCQTFRVDETGAFLTSVDLFFASRDPNENLTVEIRTVELGIPTTQLIQDYAYAVVSPDQIRTSQDAEDPTRVTFPSPIYLEPNQEYALVLGVTQSINYEVWISRMGEKTVNTKTLPDAESVIVTKQYTGGSLFKSQNGSIWTPSQYEDMKFQLYKADFIGEAGTLTLYNSPMGKDDGNIPKLPNNSLKTLPRKLKVGIVTTSDTDGLLLNGVRVSDSTAATAVHGYIEKVGGPVQTLVVTGVGTGFAPSQNFTQVPLYNITGNGSGMTASVSTNASGEISAASITANTGGSGYIVGDLLGITTSNVTKGKGALITVSATNGKSTLYLKNVQGEEFTTGEPLVVESGNSQVSLANTTFLSSATYDDKYAGNVIEVSHYNHGMEADNNFVTLANIEPDTPSVLITNPIQLTDQVISVASTTEFSTYAGQSTSQGFVKINSEIIYYNSVGTNQLGIGTRGVDGTIPRIHPTDSKAFKYELNGYDLRLINSDHDMASMPVGINALKNIDNYYISLNRGSNSTGDSQVSFIDEANVGGNNIFASQNYQYDTIIPEFNTFIPNSDVNLTTQVRTVSGTSAGGNEVSFIDQGFQNVNLDNENVFSNPRMVCSEINETNRLSELPLNRSVTLNITLQTNDPNISPVVDLQDGKIVYRRTRLNQPILNYIEDGRSNRNSGDPHASVYISNQINLKNPATSLKVLISAYRDASADFRVMYQLIRADGSDTELAYTFFPGFENLNDTNGDNFGDQVIDPANNSGKPDAFVSPSLEDEFKDYQFSVDNLEEFIGYKIKIVMSGTNEAKAPRFKDLRTIALA